MFLILGNAHEDEEKKRDSPADGGIDGGQFIAGMLFLCRTKLDAGQYR